MTPEQAESRRELVHSIVLTRIGVGLAPDPASAVVIADEVEAALGESPHGGGIPPIARSQLEPLLECVAPDAHFGIGLWLKGDDYQFSKEHEKAVREMYAQAKARKLSAAVEYLKAEFGLA